MSNFKSVVVKYEDVILTTKEPGTDQAHVEITASPQKPEETEAQYRARIAKTPSCTPV